MSNYHDARSPSRYPSPEIERGEYGACDITYPRSPERAVAQNFLNTSGNNHHLVVPRSPVMNAQPQGNTLQVGGNYNGNHLAPRSPMQHFGHSPQHSPNYQQQPSPYLYPRTPSPQAFPMTKNYYNEVLSMALSAVVSNHQCRSALEHILKEKLSERKDYDNTLKRLWIFQHLVETPCQKCCFLQGDHRADDGTQIHKFRIKSKCLANHFRVSGNTPFNWLVRDFRRFHEPHSSGVAERKDLREIYYDEFGLFHHHMTTSEFLVLAEKLSGRPTTSGKKRHRTKSMEAVTSLQVPPPRPSIDRQQEQIITIPQPTSRETNSNRSRLVLELTVANSTHLVMYGEKLNQPWQKTSGPLELPTFRPEISLKYQIGRLDANLEDQEKKSPYKLFIDDQSISRNHLEIWYDTFGWMVMDSGSTLGTVITSTEIIEEDGEPKKVPIITALRSGEHRSIQQGDVINLSDGVVQLTVLYHKYCGNDSA